MENQKIEEIMKGCKIVLTSVGEIMFGCPSEIVKVLAKEKRNVPSIIVLPAQFYKLGVVQASLEFPLYHFLFVQGKFFQGEKMIIVGTKEQIERIRTILRLTLLGPTEKEMKRWKIDEEEIKYHLSVSNYLALKEKDKIVKIDEMVDFTVFSKKREVEIEGAIIKNEDENVFTVIDQEKESFVVDINFSEPQKPPISIEVPEQSVERPILGVTGLSTCRMDLILLIIHQE